MARDDDGIDAVSHNEVRLRGRVAQDPVEKVMPSGDTMRSLRLVVQRPPGASASRQSVDALECVAWAGRVKRSCATWREGDVVEVSGSLRRRFFRTPAGAVSRVEVELSGGRLIRRSAT